MKKASIIRIVITIVVAVACVFLIAWALGAFNTNKEITYTEFRQLLEDNKVSKVYVEGSYKACILLEGSSIKRFPSNYDKFVNLDNRAYIVDIIAEYNQTHTDHQPKQARTA